MVVMMIREGDISHAQTKNVREASLHKHVDILFSDFLMMIHVPVLDFLAKDDSRTKM
jgi:hypothetical protein